MTAHDPNTRLVIDAEQVAWHEPEDGAPGELTVAHLTTSTMLSLNNAGALLFRRLADGATPAELTQALVDGYGVDADQARRDVETFVAALQARGLLISDS